MSTNVRFFLSHNTFKIFKTYFSSASTLYISRENVLIVHGNFITNDVVCTQFVTAL